MNDPIASIADYDPFAPTSRIEFEPTPGQREIWLSSHAGSGSGRAYNETFSVRLTGKIDEAALLASLNVLPEFHEALRGHFSEDGERFIIEPSLPPAVARHDLSSIPADGRADALTRIEASYADDPYDLEAGPLFRAAIVRLGEDESTVMLCAHHAVCDGWSLDVLLADLGRLYSAFAGGGALPAPPRHGFSDFASLLRTPEYLSKAGASRAFWKEKLATLPPPLELPLDGARPARRSYGARYAERLIPRESMAASKEFARARGISYFSVLLSTLAAMLYRISGAVDFVIGIPIAGHPDAGMEDCVGHLVNLVPIRFAFRPELSFLDLYHATNASVLDAMDNATIGFGEIVAGLKIPRDPARVPLVAVVFTHVHKYAPGKLAFGECAVDYRLNARRFETFELNLDAVESWDGVEIKAHANFDLFSQGWLEGRLSEYESLLTHGCLSPDAAVGKLALPIAVGAATLMTGKVDGAVDAGAESEAPPVRRPAPPSRSLSAKASSIERTIREIWEKQLGYTEFGNDSNLFDIGGNSPIALRIVLEAEKALNREIDLAVLFEYPTVDAFSRFIIDGDDEAGALQRGSSIADRVRRRRESMGE
jgi:hypothetical protein